MIPKQKIKIIQGYFKPLMALGLGVVFCAAALPARAQQNQQQQDEVQNGAPPSDSQAQSQGQPQGQPDAGPMQPPQYAQPQDQQGPQAQGQPNQTVPPQTLTVPAGTIVRKTIVLVMTHRAGDGPADDPDRRSRWLITGFMDAVAPPATPRS